MTKIEWTEKTWNPVTGCTKVSEACQNCYAAVMANRLSGMPGSISRRNHIRRKPFLAMDIGNASRWKPLHDIIHLFIRYQSIDETDCRIKVPVLGSLEIGVIPCLERACMVDHFREIIAPWHALGHGVPLP